MSTDNIYTIYKVTDLTNNKIYIGATTNLGARWREHVYKALHGFKSALYDAIREHGAENFKLPEALEICEGNVKAEEREIWWTTTLSATNPDIGYNRRLGGGLVNLSEEARRKVSEAHKGKAALNRKPILQYSKDGAFIQEYPSVSHAVTDTGIAKTSILRVINKEAMKPSKKNPYIWLYKPEDSKDIALTINPSDYYINLDYKAKMSDACKKARESRLIKNGSVENLATPVEQYSLTGELIKVFKSIKEAERETGVSSATIRKYINDENYINTVSENRRRYNWKKGDVNDESLKITREDVLKASASKHTTVIELYNKQTGEITEIAGITKAAAFLHTDYRMIKHHILHNTECKGYLLNYKQ